MPNWKKVIVSGSDAVLNSLNVVTALTASGLNYPTTDGLYSGQVIQTNAAGNLTFGDINGIYQTIKNGEATSLTVGTVVYVSGSQGANPIVYRADAADPNKMPVQYIIPETISSGAIGRGLLLGVLEGYNVGSAAAGTLLWVDGNGTLTTTRPTGSSDTTQPIAIVTKTGAGGQLSVLNPGPILLPNLQTGYTWIGNGNNYPIAVATSSIKNVVSSSYASASTSASYTLNATTASTASYVNTLNQNVLITGSLTIGSSSLGSNENTLALGPPPAGGAGEGGQILLQASGGLYTSASMWDNWQNYTRLLRGTNASSDAVVAQFNMHTKQVTFPQYNSSTAFVGTAAAYLAVDNAGNILTTSGSGGSGLSGGSANYVARWASSILLTTGSIYDSASRVGIGNTSPGYTLDVSGDIRSTGAVYANANGTMYFRGGDDAELWDVNIANTVGVYGQQDQGVASIKLGSGGGIISGRSSSIGIGTTTPISGALHVNGGVFANSFTGSFTGSHIGPLTGTASYATTASYSNTSTSASYALNATTSSYALTATSASYSTNSTTASTASFVNPLNQNVVITGSLAINNGYVGIGTPSPAYNLQILDTTSGTPQQLDIKNSTAAARAAFTLTNDASNSLYMQIAGTNYTAASLRNVAAIASQGTSVDSFWIATNWESSTGGSVPIKFITGGYSNTPSLTITAGNPGNIGIGKTSPNAKLDVNGNTIITGSLNVTAGITGSLLGTASTASFYGGSVTSASYASNATTAQTASFVVTAQTASFVNAAQTASYVNPLNQNVIITGSASNSLRVKGSGATSATNTLYLENSSNINTFAVADNGNVTVNTGSLTINQATGTGIGIALKAPADYYSPKLEFNAIGGTSRIIQGYGGALFLEGGNALQVCFGIYSAAGTVSNVNIYTYPYGGSQPAYPNNYSMLIKNPDTTGVNLMIRAAGGQPGTGSVTEWQNSGGTEVVAKITASGSAYFKSDVSASSFTGSLLGTASTASYVVTAQTASFYGGSVTSASYASNATSASYAPGGTVNTGTSAKLAYYPSTGDTVDDAANLEYDGTNLKILSTAQLDFYTNAGSIYFGTFGSPTYGRAGFSVPGQAVMVVDYSNARAGFGGGTSLITSAPAGLVEIQGKTDEIQLLVKGNGTQTNNILEIQKSTGAILYYLDNNGDAKLASGSLGVGIAPNGTDGRIDASNDIVAFSTSDINWKTNIKPIENAIDKVKQISGNTFDWIEDTNPVGKIHGNKGKDIGVIAQEIEKVLPEIVTTRESGTKAVKYEKIVALLIEAIKEQQQQIDELKSKLK